MADISMCLNDDCPKKWECYRYTATPSGVWQPFINPKHEGCEHFLQNNSQMYFEEVISRKNERIAELEANYETLRSIAHDVVNEFNNADATLQGRLSLTLENMVPLIDLLEAALLEEDNESNR
jgi:hypothetical protein